MHCHLQTGKASPPRLHPQSHPWGCSASRRQTKTDCRSWFTPPSRTNRGRSAVDQEVCWWPTESGPTSHRRPIGTKLHRRCSSGRRHAHAAIGGGLLAALAKVGCSVYTGAEALRNIAERNWQSSPITAQMGLDAEGLAFNVHEPGRIGFVERAVSPKHQRDDALDDEWKCKTGLNAPCLPACGGSGEIRTHGRVAPSAVFKTAALNRSATLPLKARSLTVSMHAAGRESAFSRAFAPARRPPAPARAGRRPPARR